jgi:hypothetical protein
MVSDLNCLKYFCVYYNHQVHRDFLITLYRDRHQFLKSQFEFTAKIDVLAILGYDVPVHAINAYVGRRGTALLIFTSALNGREWSPIHPSRITPAKAPLVSTKQTAG